MKKGLLIIAAVLMLAGSLQAGEIKTHQWPCAFVPQFFMTIPVTMDIGYWIRVKDQTKYKIKLTQASGTYHTYDGCVTIKVESNFAATLSATIAQDPAISGSVGNLSVDLTPSNVPAMATTDVKVCAHLTNANLNVAPAGTTGVQVAIVTITVVPTV